jgi:hypothetical protein
LSYSNQHPRLYTDGVLLEKDDELPNEFYEAMLDDDLDEQDLYNGNMEMEDFNRNN